MSGTAQPAPAANGSPARTQGRILVIRGGAIGDFILTLPAIAALRQQFPEAHLALLGYPHIAQLATEWIDQLQSIEARALAGFFARNGDLNPDLAAYFRSFNLILSYLYDPDEIFQTNVARSSSAQFIAGPHRPDENANLHATETFLSPLQRLAIFDANPIPQVRFPPSPGLPNHFVPRIALHPGSGSDQKNWPENKWRALLEHLRNSTPLNFLIVGGEAEGERVQRLASLLPPTRVQLAHHLPLLDLARLLQLCQGFIGHDSGISHLAAAVGLKGIVLWSHSNPNIWRPRSNRFLLIESTNGIAHLPVETVAAAVHTQFTTPV